MPNTHREHIKISVLIPVYNAEDFVTEAVLSALRQPETAEVILVEDCSPDNSLNVCKKLIKDFDKVKLFQHPDQKNRGAGASRNLAIKKASYDIVAFLDADDFYLPNRFSKTAKLLLQDELIDGVCEAVGFYYQDKINKNTENHQCLTTMKRHVTSEKMFYRQTPIGNEGYCPTPGWTIRKRLFERSGIFDEHLCLHQDTALFIKFTAVGKIVPGQLKKAVAMRRVHKNNRITAPRSPEGKFHDRLLMWETLYEWGKANVSIRKSVTLFISLMLCFLKGSNHYTLQNKKPLRYLYMLSKIPKFLYYFVLRINGRQKTSP